MNKFIIKKSTIAEAGKGVFSRQLIGIEEIVAFAGGERNAHFKQSDITAYINDAWPNKQPNIFIYPHTSPSGNVLFRWKALKPIYPGDELLADYDRTRHIIRRMGIKASKATIYRRWPKVYQALISRVNTRPVYSELIS